MKYQPKLSPEMTTIYISGKMHGTENYNKEKFDAAEKTLTSKGYDVVNPNKLEHYKKWEDCMFRDIKIILQSCQAVAVLDDWEDSKGAKAEVFVAKTTGIPVFDVNTFELVTKKLEVWIS